MPAQPNQPLSAHPISTLLGYKILGYLPVLKSNITDEDRLLIGAPAASPNGSVTRLSCLSRPATVKIEDDGGGALSANDIRLMLKLADGREIRLAGNPGGETTGAFLYLIPNESFPLTDVGSGLYLRVVADVVVSCFADTFDIRSEALAYDVTDVAHEEEGPGPGQVLVPVNNLNLACGIIANFDSVAHGFTLTASDGTQSLSLTVPSPALGIGAYLRAPTAPFPLGEGWSISLALTEPVVTNAPRLFMAQQMANLSPVRSNQGGAY